MTDSPALALISSTRATTLRAKSKSDLPDAVPSPASTVGRAAVAGFADVGIELDFSEVGNSKLRRRLLRAAAGENVGLMIAVRAHEVAHVLDHADQIHLHLAEHFDGFARILQAKHRRASKPRSRR